MNSNYVLSPDIRNNSQQKLNKCFLTDSAQNKSWILTWRFILAGRYEMLDIPKYLIQNCAMQEYLAWNEDENIIGHLRSNETKFVITIKNYTENDKAKIKSEWLVIESGINNSYLVKAAGFTEDYDLYSGVETNELNESLIQLHKRQNKNVDDKDAKRLWKFVKSSNFY